MNKIWRIAGIIVVVAVLIATMHFSVCRKGPVKIDSGFRPVMGTFAHIIAVAADSNTANKAIEAAFDQLQLVDKLMSDYKPDSELSKINREAFKNPVTVSEPLFEVLSRSVAFSKKTDGAFDITVGPLVDLFHSAQEKGIAPTQEEIAQAKQRTGFDKLTLDEKNKTVKFAAEGMRLDLGGIAKGYAVDKAVEAMQSCGAIGGLVDAGGDIRCFGSSRDKKNVWIIGIQDPNNTADVLSTAKPLLVLHLTDAAVATSGDYRRFTKIGGKRYSHIIDTKSGTSSQNLSSVTIIAPNATDADALATAVSVLGIEKGLKLIKIMPQTDAILILSQNLREIIKTDGAERYIYSQ